MTSTAISSSAIAILEDRPANPFKGMLLRAKPKWPDPQSSLGVEFTPLRQHLKIRRRWDAQGEALKAFYEIAEELKIFKARRDDLDQFEGKSAIWGWTCCMYGRAPHDARPAIVVHCDSKSCCERVVREIQLTQWWNQFHSRYPAFSFIVSSKAPRPIALGGATKLATTAFPDRNEDSQNEFEQDFQSFSLEPTRRSSEPAFEWINDSMILLKSPQSIQSQHQSLSQPLDTDADDFSRIEIESVCGLRVSITSTDGQGNRNSRLATIGGVLYIGGVPHAITARHALTPIGAGPASALQNEYDNQFEDVDFLDDSDEDMEVINEFVAITSKGSISPQESNGSTETGFASITEDSSDTGAPVVEGKVDPQQPGMLSENLAKTETPDSTTASYLPCWDSALPANEFSLMSDEELDWAVVPIDQFFFLNNCQVNFVRPRSEASDDIPFVVSKIAVPPSVSAAVFVVTSSGDCSRCLIKGTLSTAPFFLGCEIGERFFKRYTVRLESKLFPGDCGAWVIDAATGDLYGHIVAGQSDSTTAFLVAAIDIKTNIEKLSGSFVTLPTMQDVAARYSKSKEDEELKEDEEFKEDEEDMGAKTAKAAANFTIFTLERRKNARADRKARKTIGDWQKERAEDAKDLETKGKGKDKSSYAAAQPLTGNKSSPGQSPGTVHGRHSSISDVSSHRSDKPLDPVSYDKTDPASVKRARNTEAARKSRTRKLEWFET